MILITIQLGKIKTKTRIFTWLVYRIFAKRTMKASPTTWKCRWIISFHFAVLVIKTLIKCGFVSWTLLKLLSRDMFLFVKRKKMDYRYILYLKPKFAPSEKKTIRHQRTADRRQVIQQLSTKLKDMILR